LGSQRLARAWPRRRLRAPGKPAQAGLDGQTPLISPTILLFVCTLRVVRISYDPAKNQRNIRERGLSFDAAAEFDFEGALYAVDDRRDYGEKRYVGVGLCYGRLHVLCFVETTDGVRVISFRKANPREVKRYAQTKAAD
jgi:uncharacterized DUF497 family protein